jgi:hypothetical protein
LGILRSFAGDIRDDERTIWHCTCWGRGGPQREAQARWGRGLAVTARHCYGPTKGRGGPNPAGPHCHGPARGRGGSSPTTRTPIVVPLEGTGGLVVTVDDKGPDDEGLVPPLVSSSPFFLAQKHRRFFLLFFLKNAVDL